MLLLQHEAIGAAIITGDGDDAEAAATEHIRFTAETLEKLKDEEMRLGRVLRRLSRDDVVRKS